MRGSKWKKRRGWLEGPRIKHERAKEILPRPSPFYFTPPPPPPPSTPPSILTLGLRLVDPQGPAVQFHSVHLRARHLGLLGRHGDEGKAARAAVIPVGGEEAIGDYAVLLEHGPDGFVGGLEGEVADVQLHLVPSLGIEGAESSGSESLAPPSPSPSSSPHAPAVSSPSPRPSPAEVGRSLPPGLGLVDAESAAVELTLIHLAYGVLGRIAIGEGDESESAGAVGAPLHGQEDVGDLAVGSEYLAKLGLVGGLAYTCVCI
jgi:hypothetical protein